MQEMKNKALTNDDIYQISELLWWVSYEKILAENYVCQYFFMFSRKKLWYDKSTINFGNRKNIMDTEEGEAHPWKRKKHC